MVIRDGMWRQYGSHNAGTSPTSRLGGWDRAGLWNRTKTVEPRNYMSCEQLATEGSRCRQGTTRHNAQKARAAQGSTTRKLRQQPVAKAHTMTSSYVSIWNTRSRPIWRKAETCSHGNTRSVDGATQPLNTPHPAGDT